MTTSPDLQRSKSPASTILLAGLIAGTLDACGAMTHYMINSHGGNPLLIWRSVAGGAFGDTARSGTLFPWAVVGILFHFLIVFLFTIFFFFIYPRIKAIQKNLIVTGLLYGIFVWIVMNLIVLPFSNIRSQGKLWTFVNTNGKLHAVFHGPSNTKQMIIGILIIMFCVGLPISLIIGKYYARKRVKPLRV
jgi:hypothetical protein